NQKELHGVNPHVIRLCSLGSDVLLFFYFCIFFITLISTFLSCAMTFRCTSSTIFQSLALSMSVVRLPSSTLLSARATSSLLIRQSFLAVFANVCLAQYKVSSGMPVNFRSCSMPLHNAQLRALTLE